MIASEIVFIYREFLIYSLSKSAISTFAYDDDDKEKVSVMVTVNTDTVSTTIYYLIIGVVIIALIGALIWIYNAAMRSMTQSSNMSTRSSNSLMSPSNSSKPASRQQEAMHKIRKNKDTNYYTGYRYSIGDFPFKILVRCDKLWARHLSTRMQENTMDIVKYCAKTINNQLNFRFFDLDEIHRFDCDSERERDESTIVIKFVRGRHTGELGCPRVTKIFSHEETDPHEAFDGPGNILAHATLPPYKCVCFDLDDTWDGNLFCSALLHELGHILGLLHPVEMPGSFFPPTSIMHDPSDMYELQDFDLTSMRALYEFLPK